MNLLKKIFSINECRFLFLILSLFSLLRLPSLFEPNWYGDEGIYQVLGRAMRNGRVLYEGIWDNKPPLLYLTYAIADANHFLIRLLSYIAGILAVYLFYLVCKELFTSPKIRYLSTTVFAVLFSLPLTEANIANAENFMLVFLLGAGLLIVRASWNHFPADSRRKLFWAGILVGVAFLYKIVALFDFAAFFLFISFLLLPKRIILTKKVFSHLTPALIFLSGFLLPVAITTLYFLFVGGFSAYVSATFSNNVSYVGYKNYFLIPQGLLLMKLLLLGIFVLFLFWKRQMLSKPSLFVFLWFAFSFFNVFFSQRPYTHYLLVGITSFALLIGLILSEKKYRVVAVALLVAGIIATDTVFSLMSAKHITAYYQNFISYVSGQKTTEAYQSFFDPDVPRTYEIAQFIKSHKKENSTIFIWGNSAQIYTLSDTLPPGRYTVAYHITSAKALEETQHAIDKEKPHFIIIQPQSPTLQLPLTAYRYKATIAGATIYERTF